MVYFTDAQVYLEQSVLLLQARPTTTRISTRYTVAKPPSSTNAKSSGTATAADPLKPRGILILKTYDPVSGTCLKYRTNKASEIGRLVSGLQRCARVMAAVPPQDESSEPAEAAKEEAAPEQAKAAPAAAASGGGGGGGGGGKKKKKGKK